MVTDFTRLYGSKSSVVSYRRWTLRMQFVYGCNIEGDSFIDKKNENNGFILLNVHINWGSFSISSMNKLVSNSSPSIFDFKQNFFRQITENIGQQEPIASKRVLQLNTSMDIYIYIYIFRHVLTHVIARRQSICVIAAFNAFHEK